MEKSRAQKMKFEHRNKTDYNIGGEQVLDQGKRYLARRFDNVEIDI